MARGRRGRGITDYNWGNFGGVAATQDLSNGSGIQGATAFAFSQASTLVRIRGKVAMTLDPGGADESVLAVCGLILMSADAFAAVAPPEPVTLGVSDATWIWTGQLYLSSQDDATAGNGHALTDRIECDSKAMRKVKAHDRLVFVFQFSSALVVDQTGTVDVSHFFRVLTGD